MDIIRKARLEDMPAILNLYAAARAFMAANGNPTQWGSSYPAEEQLREDMAAGELYVYETAVRNAAPGVEAVQSAAPEPGAEAVRSAAPELEAEAVQSAVPELNAEAVLEAVFMFTLRPEKTYEQIEGRWLGGGVYGTIHRIASSGRRRGLASACVRWCIEQSGGHLRGDTHRDNHIMQHVFEKNGMKCCGIVWMEDGTERLAYECLPL